MNTIASASPIAHDPRPWWREPYVWLVIGGPLTVVVAGLVTAFIAVTHADPVLDRTPTQVHAPADDDSLTLAPAQQARNHAATATLPAKR